MGKQQKIVAWIEYVLQEKNWSMQRLADEARISASTITRPMKNPTAKGIISNRTLERLEAASGIDFTVYLNADDWFVSRMSKLSLHLPNEAKNELIRRAEGFYTAYKE